MSRPKIKTALIGIFVFVGLIVGSFAAYSVNRLSVINGNVSDLAINRMAGVKTAKDIAGAIAGLRVAFRDHILQDGKAETKATEDRIEAGKTAFLERVAAYEKLDAQKANSAIIDQLRVDFTGYTAQVEKLLALPRSGDNAGAVKVLYSDVTPVGSKLIATADKLVAINEKAAEDTYNSSQSVYATSLYITFLSIALCATVIGLSIWFALSGIAGPIQTITASMKKLAEGDSTTAIPYDGRADEIGEMAAAVEVFRTNAVANLRLEQEAAANRSLTEEQRQQKAAADRARAEEMAEATAGLGEGLKHLAGGDLTFQLADPFAPDFETLRADFNAAVSQLSETLRAVAEATSGIDTGSKEVSASADDLSKRTEQQAAALEETAAALDQITVNVANSSKRAEEARKVAVQANESAAQSGRVVANAVDAMQKIEASSNQVSNIIGVIDEIAFQTNLLALNAGVEAARAGDAGKGFAVVAQEVRELAQRSAQAAKEIKDLIRNSSVEVQNGVKLVSDTGEALKTIEGYIVTVNQHMDSIATSAKEQSVGLAEVNTAVNQMDQVTQQNAAMVEETSAAGATLASESGKLRDLISQFQLGATLRQTASAMAAGATHRPVASPVRKLAGKVARAFSGNAAVKEG
ncbi:MULTISPECIES: methyl-accepting chemotaxis protein [unclassified Rhizobium]|uniref:methyl-accepting chemotaxis protein n=1 Tax=unclassified Rhizobium TaxID=2613769 RepID=UPI001ADD198E|nr:MULTISPECIES: methyl-accepting chemotaxis protein [unclassified Rhizobium]MBO9101885.1 methyl-accepting chemotaxis protein [Rhizobium sp. L58/93]MBO9172056.1 methyl-accepting chemotaxis protein [Rhizobium sp. L245/93]QXZ88279.1 methyl-accepting chemotaxis protein [Rhizobium sp. K1/93]QXZ94250.1 methyl-accepting chemotaxis protein [Rhizobium sp. K15/93]QYA05660.1 methyl-accepting chemotaxis protein [Rhizobium sp. B21/90]